MSHTTFFFPAAARAVFLPSAPDRSAEALLRILLDTPKRQLAQLLLGCPWYQRTALLNELVGPHDFRTCSAWAVSCENGRVARVGAADPVHADPHVEVALAATAMTAAVTHDVRTVLPPRDRSRFPSRLDQRALSSVP